MVVLAADVGGTNTRLGLYDSAHGALVELKRTTIRCSDQRHFEEAVSAFLASATTPVDAACIAVAGPAFEGLVRVTNLGWKLSAPMLAERWAISHVELLNDLEAAAEGLAELDADETVVLHRGKPGAVGNRVLISPGTGLGEAILYWDGATHRPFATEGGHASFAPENDLETKLLRYLRTRFDHVSWERVVSGSGLVHLAEALAHLQAYDFPEHLERALNGEHGPAAVATAAREGRCEVCRSAVALFVQLLASEAGNLALKAMARGGVYIGGGIPPRFERELRRSSFLNRFCDKGRMREQLESMAVVLVRSDRAGVLGAARRAAARVQSSPATSRR